MHKNFNLVVRCARLLDLTIFLGEFAMNKKLVRGILLTCLLLVVMIFPAEAAWRRSQGSCTWVAPSGRQYNGTWYDSINAGIVKIGNYKYCFDANGRKKKGFVKISDKETYYFAGSKGRMVCDKIRTINRKVYYFKADGCMARRYWVGNTYYGKNGYRLANAWVGSRYIGPKGVYLTGLQKVRGSLYYFNKKTGKKLVNAIREMNGKVYAFGADGKGQISSKAGVAVETQYYTDPQVSDADLLAAIIYTESGNQPYYGQLAVGLVITNRMRSSQFPNTLKEVIYAKQQFEPARTGVLTRLLSNISSIPATTRKAGEQVWNMYKKNLYRITVNGKKKSMKDYLFFMTPAAYQRLGLRSPYTRLDGHVFFKNWVR